MGRVKTSLPALSILFPQLEDWLFRRGGQGLVCNEAQFGRSPLIQWRLLCPSTGFYKCVCSAGVGGRIGELTLHCVTSGARTAGNLRGGRTDPTKPGLEELEDRTHSEWHLPCEVMAESPQGHLLITQWNWGDCPPHTRVQWSAWCLMVWAHFLPQGQDFTWQALHH